MDFNVNNILKLKYVDENNHIRYIKPWANFINEHGETKDGRLVYPASEAIKEWDGFFTMDVNNKNYADYQIVFGTEEAMTYWLLRWS